MVSTLWSIDPSTTLRGGIQMVITVLIGIVIGVLLDLRGIVTCTAVALTIGLLMCGVTYFLGIWPPFFDKNDVFIGAYPQKNLLGHAMVVLFIIAWLSIFAGDRRTRVRLGFVVIAMISAVLVIVSHSASALGSMVASPLIATVIGLYRNIGRWPIVFAWAIVTTIAALAFAFVIVGINPTDVVLDMLGRDASLTGRTAFWQYGMDIAKQRPLDGIGYLAFWSSEDYSAIVSVWRKQNGDGVNGFHNLFIEVLVATGIPGLLALLAGLGLSLKRVLLDSANNQTMNGVIASVLVITMIGLAAFDNKLVRPHEIGVILLSAFTVASLREKHSS